MLTDTILSSGRAADLVDDDGAAGAVRSFCSPAASPAASVPHWTTSRRRPCRGCASRAAPATSGRKLRRAVAERLPRPRWLANWLVDDVVGLASLMTALMGASALRLTLDMDDDGRAFGIADVGLRLVTTYRGPGIEWLSPRWARSAENGFPPSAAAVRRLARGDVAVLRGGRGASPKRPGVLHRAPETSAGACRWSLTVDDLGRSLH